MTPDEIKVVLDAHGKRLRDEGGATADLRNADLAGADLYCANLRGADLYGADLAGADLRNADLRRANLRCSSMYGADLRNAGLRSADLYDANMRNARVHGAHWPSPTMVLLVQWGNLPDDLTADLMRFDAWCHPDAWRHPGPSAFLRWAQDSGPCPYEGAHFQRAALFWERKDLMTPALLRKRPRSPYELTQRLLAECCDTSKEGE